MPLYEYLCSSCGATSEILARSAEEKPVCPACGSKRMAKQLSAFAAPAASPSMPACATPACAAGSCAGGGCPFA